MKRYAEGGLAAANDEEELGPDPMTGYLSLLAQQFTTSPEAQDRAREILDAYQESSSGTSQQELIERFQETAEQSRQALREARERILGNQYDPRQKWLAAAAAFGQPTRTGAFGETLGNVAGSLRGPLAEEQQFNQNRDNQLLSLDQALSGVDEGLLMNEFKLQELNRRTESDMAKEALKILGKTSSGKAPTRTPGGKSYDQKMATITTDWDTQGRADAIKSLSELGEALEALRTSDKISGPYVGLIPKGARDVLLPESGNTQDLIETTAQRSLKAILGGSFGEKEGQMLLARTFNPRLEEADNERRAFRLFKQLEIAMKQKNDATEYFKQHQTMDGYEGKFEWTLDDFEPDPIMVNVELPEGTTLQVPKGSTLEEVRKIYQEETGKTPTFKRGGRIRQRYAEGGEVVSLEDFLNSSNDEEDFESIELDELLDDGGYTPEEIALLTSGTAAGTAGTLGLEDLGARLEEMRSGFQRPSKAEKLISQGMEISGVDPNEMITQVKRANRLGVPEMPLDRSGRATRGLVEQAIIQGGDLGEGAIDTLTERQEGSRDRVGRQVEKNLKTPEFFELESKLTDRLYDRARPLYEQAYSENPAIKVPAFWGDLTSNKYGKAALKSAMELMQLEGKQIGKEDVAGMVRKPSLEFFDYVKRGFDQIIRKEENMGSTPLGRALRTQRKKLVSYLDNPDNVTEAYAKARAQYKGDLEVLEALDTGRTDFYRMAPKAAETMMDNMTPAEKYALRAGVAQKLYEIIYNPSSDIKAARRLVGSPEMKKRLELLFDKKSEWRIFEAAMEREMELFDKNKSMLNRAERGRESRMDRALAEGEDLMFDVKNWISHSPLAWAMRIIPSFGKRTKKLNLKEKDADEIIEILTTTDPQELNKLGPRLEAVTKRSNVRRGRRGKAGIVGAGVGAALSAIGLMDDEDE